ncbi:MAG: hypothetical protein AAF357_01490 [Verrucomicrobiota bacterium]
MRDPEPGGDEGWDEMQLPLSSIAPPSKLPIATTRSDFVVSWIGGFKRIALLGWEQGAQRGGG